MTLQDVLQGIVAQAPGSDFFLQAARLPEPADFGVLSYAIASCASGVDALKLALTHRLFDHQFGALVIGDSNADGPDAARVTVAWERQRNLPEACAQAAELEAVSSLAGLLAWREQQRGNPTPVVVGLHVAYPEPVLQITDPQHQIVASAEDFERHFGVRPVFDASRTAVAFHLSCTETLRDYRRNRGAFEAAVPLLGEQGQALCAAHQAGEGLSDQLLRALVGSFGAVGRADRAAAALNTSERTMRRRLSQEGSSFQKILDRYRCALAEDYLSTTALSTQQIGELLGFTEATNFRRAFLRWTGRSPHDHRTALRQSA
jgi:AraC-like DNA-binding protein